MTIRTKSTRLTSSDSIDHIHAQMSANPQFPFDVLSSWLPKPTSLAMKTFFEQTIGAPSEPRAPSVQAMDDFLSSNPVLTYLIEDACKQNSNIFDSHPDGEDVANFPRIASKDDLLNAFNTLLTHAPQYVESELVGLPYSALVVGIDPTQSGMALFRLPMFNEKMSGIFDDWFIYLGSEKSNWIFGKEGEQWLSPVAKASYQFEVWAKDSETLPYWSSWNSFFTRQFKDRDGSRPIAAPKDNATVVSANDGSLFRWDENIAPTEAYWFKDMLYSLSDILSSPVPDQQEILDKHDVVALFENGSIFQTYLNPYNYHRWWCPVNGEVLFDPLVVPGNFFDKLVIPDFGGATTASLPYLAQVNARGIMVIKTPDFGYVGCIPLGMSEVSSIVFDKKMFGTPDVDKGQEMGKFEYGGSSYALIFQKIPGKRLMFQNAAGEVYQKRPVLPKGSASTGGNVTLIGAQIGKWEDVVYNVAANEQWHNVGHINEGKRYSLEYIGGLWSADVTANDGTLYDANGSGVKAPMSYPLPGAPVGALIGQIGANPPFLIGNQAQTPDQQTGQFHVVINDDLAADRHETNIGQVTMAVEEIS